MDGPVGEHVGPRKRSALGEEAARGHGRRWERAKGGKTGTGQDQGRGRATYGRGTRCRTKEGRGAGQGRGKREMLEARPRRERG